MKLYYTGSSLSAGIGTVPFPEKYAHISLGSWPNDVSESFRKQLYYNTPAWFLGQKFGLPEENIFMKAVNGNSWSYMISHAKLWATAARQRWPEEKIFMVISYSSPHLSDYIPLENDYYFRWCLTTYFKDTMKSFRESGRPYFDFHGVFQRDTKLLEDVIAVESIPRETKQMLSEKYSNIIDHAVENMETLFDVRVAEYKITWLCEVKSIIAFLKSLDVDCIIIPDWLDPKHVYPQDHTINELFQEHDMMLGFHNGDARSSDYYHPSTEQNRDWADYVYKVIHKRQLIK